MKKYIVSLCLSSLMLGGCNSLDLNPLSSGSSESWYSNETEVEMSLNRLFNIQFWESIQFDDGSYMHKDSWTDNWTERIKGLIFEGDGYLLVYKRLSAGRFRWPRTQEEAMAITRYSSHCFGFSPAPIAIKGL